MPNTSLESVTFELIKYLAGEGFGLTDKRKQEIEARLLGHRSAYNRAVYEQRAKRYQVLHLAPEDCPDGDFDPANLSATYQRTALAVSDDQGDALRQARELATERGCRFIVCDENYENHVLVVPPSRLEGFELRGTTTGRITCTSPDQGCATPKADDAVAQPVAKSIVVLGDIHGGPSLYQLAR